MTGNIEYTVKYILVSFKLIYSIFFSLTVHEVLVNTGLINSFIVKTYIYIYIYLTYYTDMYSKTAVLIVPINLFSMYTSVVLYWFFCKTTTSYINVPTQIHSFNLPTTMSRKYSEEWGYLLATGCSLDIILSIMHHINNIHSKLRACLSIDWNPTWNSNS